MTTKFMPSQHVAEEMAKKPAKRWRNKYWSPVRVRCTITKEIIPPGHFWGVLVHPSKDVAETNAATQMDLNHLDPRLSEMRYEGAFPLEGEP